MQSKIFSFLALVLSVSQTSIARNYNQELMDVLMSGRYSEAKVYYQQSKF